MQVEVDLRAGLPAFAVVGLPDAAVQEARERVRSGLVNQAFAVPARPHRRQPRARGPAQGRAPVRPAHRPGAPGRLAASCAARRGAGVGAVGELALDGSLRPVPGALAMAEHAARAGMAAARGPGGQRRRGRAGARRRGARRRTGLRDAVDLLEGRASPSGAGRRRPTRCWAGRARGRGPTSARCAGRAPARRALEVAAAGATRPSCSDRPGAARRCWPAGCSGILPPMALDEAIAVTRIHSVAGLLDPGCPLVDPATVPRAPPHDLGRRAGRRRARPAARRGQPGAPGRPVPGRGLRVRPVGPGRAAPAARGGPGRRHAGRWSTARFPARPLLVCAGNPCPCGFDGDPRRRVHRARPGALGGLPGAPVRGPWPTASTCSVDVPRLERDELMGAPRSRATAVCARGSRRRARSRGPRPAGPNAELGPVAGPGRAPCSTRTAGRCSPAPWTGSASRRGPTTGCCAWRAPSPTSTAQRAGRGPTTWPRRCGYRPRRQGLGWDRPLREWPLGLARLAPSSGAICSAAARAAGGPERLWPLRRRRPRARRCASARTISTGRSRARAAFDGGPSGGDWRARDRPRRRARRAAIPARLARDLRPAVRAVPARRRRRGAGERGRGGPWSRSSAAAARRRRASPSRATWRASSPSGAPSVVSGLALGIDARRARGRPGRRRRHGRGARVRGGRRPPSPPPRPGAAHLRRAGALVSEYWPGTPPAPWRFPARNRIVAGLAGAVVVVEAGRRSGALITADFALELGRPVLAVPGARGRGRRRAATRFCAPAPRLLRGRRGRRRRVAGTRLGRRRRAGPAPRRPACAGRIHEALERSRCAPDRLGRPRGGAGAVAAALARLEVEGHVVRGEGQRFWARRRRHGEP